MAVGENVPFDSGFDREGDDGHDSEKRLRDQLEATQRRLADLHQQSRQQQKTIEVLARIVNVLTVENNQLTTQLSHQRARKLVAPTRRERSMWTSPEIVEACTMRSSHAKNTKEVRSGVP